MRVPACSAGRNLVGAGDYRASPALSGSLLGFFEKAPLSRPFESDAAAASSQNSLAMDVPGRPSRLKVGTTGIEVS
eukprot:CAMPEP_0194520326 /NCGR_PEP_ID=MMETSP0253-20130528/54256_1 /TAXON_ID=2966 /ORGANISM="Noctiluca scintillans" /LENGTH=75 /DNA_ID=CAMNT_0039364543 /DNA_START=391 /DNA_END=618 /DNA_ORIENTATION=-